MFGLLKTHRLIRASGSRRCARCWRTSHSTTRRRLIAHPRRRRWPRIPPRHRAVGHIGRLPKPCRRVPGRRGRGDPCSTHGDVLRSRRLIVRIFNGLPVAALRCRRQPNPRRQVSLLQAQAPAVSRVRRPQENRRPETHRTVLGRLETRVILRTCSSSSGGPPPCGARMQLMTRFSPAHLSVATSGSGEKSDGRRTRRGFCSPRRRTRGGFRRRPSSPPSRTL